MEHKKYETYGEIISAAQEINRAANELKGNTPVRSSNSSRQNEVTEIYSDQYVSKSKNKYKYKKKFWNLKNTSLAALLGLGSVTGVVAMVTQKPETPKIETKATILYSEDFPSGAPFKSEYSITQEYGCTSFEYEPKAPECKGNPAGERKHYGMDFASKEGRQPLIATMKGVIDYAGDAKDGLGNKIVIKGSVVNLTYGHLSSFSKKVGDSVKPGDVIGIEGTTGASTGLHVHYAVSLDGVMIDPMPFYSNREGVILGSPTVSAAKIDEVLKSYNSPAFGTGIDMYNLGVKYGINPAWALAFFVHESSAGTKGVARDTKGLGNIRCTKDYECIVTEGNGSFRKYNSYKEGYEDFYKLLSNLYIKQWNLVTVKQIIPVYAPSADKNNPDSYIRTVIELVNSWRS